MIVLYAAGACASAAIVAGAVALLAAPNPLPRAVPMQAVVARPVVAAPSQPVATPPTTPAPPLTGNSPVVATNGRMTIRLVGGQPEP